MTERIIVRILRESGVANLLELLGHDLAPTDMQSLLLEVFRRRAARQTPSRVLEQYEQNRFARPSLVDARALLELDLLALASAVPPFEALELSPLAPLGTCSALAPVDQNQVVSTIRNTEVLSDPTNVLALECALRRRAQRRAAHQTQEPVRLCANHRVVRAQRFDGPNLYAHFRIFTLCTAGRAGRGADFESEAVTEHIETYLRFLSAAEGQGYRFTGVRVVFIPLAGEQERDRLQQVIAPLAARFPGTQLEIDLNPGTIRDYYDWARFQIYARDSQGVEVMLADGGFTDWTQQLLSDKRERLLISGIGTERIANLFRAD
jgi:hypothetical protein